MSFPYTAGYDEVIERACDLFFPSGKSSSHGELASMVTGLAKFDHSDVTPHLKNGKPFTIKEYQKQTGLNILRLYLTTILRVT